MGRARERFLLRGLSERSGDPGCFSGKPGGYVLISRISGV